MKRTNMAEEDTRRKEIDLFSAMALGVDSDFTPSNDPHEKTAAKSSKDTRNNSRTSADNDFLAVFGGNTSNSGTFNFAPPEGSTKNRSEAEESNLNAAIALLSDCNSSFDRSKLNNTSDAKGACAGKDLASSKLNPQRIKPDDDIPMFCEKIEMPRPLFFGATLPPRVINEARAMVQDAIDAFQKENPGQNPCLRQLPPAVRNVVGAIRAFGFGLDIMSASSSNSDHKEKGLVASFQPVWGHDERAKRVKIHMKDRPETVPRPSVVSRSFTAPATMSKADLRGPKTRAGQPSGSEEEVIPDKIVSENQLFSMWLRQEDESTALSGDHSRSASQSSLKETEDGEQGKNVEDVSTSVLVPDKPEVEPPAKKEMEQFSMWATQSEGGTFVANSSDTFRPNESITKRVIDSDDESLHEDEMKKQVGISDHLSKAIALLTDEMDERAASDLSLEPSQVLSQHVPIDGSRLRPLTNFELTNGCVPLFAADDKPLPDSADLGMHETKEEQMRSNELKRSQETIERLVVPDVFGTAACPNPATRPDDIHSWNSRTTMSRQTVNVARPETLLSDTASIQTKRTTGSISSSDLGRAKASPLQTRRRESKPKRRQSRLRCGWFNSSKSLITPQRATGEKKLHAPPASLFELKKTTLLSKLQPNPNDLLENNLPLSHLHSATPIEQSLPYLSDRPHGLRYLQIDTQSVAFSSLKGEIEPLFCSLAIYNIETISPLPGADMNPVPVPDLHRCAKVTEALYFDVVGDSIIAERCSCALWPSFSSSANTDKLSGTRCGIFPLPSNLSVSNLYAVLIVRKVLSHESDLEPYLTPGMTVVDLDKLRSNAGKASCSHGSLLMPMAFGVAPLLQVFGTDNPAVATSRAVQIPLFRFNGEEKQIIEHIMVMLYPRANLRLAGIGGPAPVTNGGNAMLVMRNFGYLGIHNAVDKKSSLAKERLVDFTGELQIIRGAENFQDIPMELRSNYTARTEKWLVGFVTEPTVDGGRDRIENCDSLGPASNSYAQELAPIPLSMTPEIRQSGSSRKGRLSGQDIEPFYHTVFCNELVFQPRILHNCDKQTIVLKVEVREIEWKDGFGYIAHLPRSGSTMHNNRRGPFLVTDSFTTCSARRSSLEHYFIDEFKAKLPLDLNPKKNDAIRSLSLLFTVFHVIVNTTSPSTSCNDDERSKDLRSQGMTCLEQVACGFLCLSKDGCLVDDGSHDVQVIYKAESAPHMLCEQLECPSTSLLLVERRVENESAQFRNKSVVDVSSTTDEKESRTANFNLVHDEPISLSVRLVALTSLHSQNEVVRDFLNEESETSTSAFRPINNEFFSDIKINRHSLSKKAVSAVPKTEDELEMRLCKATSAITDNQLCSISRTSPFLLRILPILWRQLIFGHGEPNLAWSNPASFISLRLQSFLAILHLIGETCSYFSQNGVTEADGLRRWNMVSFARVVALLFDEHNLFGDQSKEAIDREYWSLILHSLSDHAGYSTTETKPRRGRHVRSRLDFSQRTTEGGAKLELRDNDIFSTVAGTLAGPLRGLGSRGSSIDSLNHNSSHASSSFDVRVDSKIDFQNALRASLAEHAEEDFDRVQSTTSAGSSAAMMQALSSFSGNGSRRFMTMPAPRTLMTISETDDGEDDNADFNEVAENYEKNDMVAAASSNILEEDSPVKRQARGVRQMRIPVRRKSKPNLEESITDATDNFDSSESAIPLIEKNSTPVALPPSDDDLEKLNIGFLDAIGENIGVSPSRASSEESSQVGLKNHRRLRSRSSIDWTLNGADTLGLSSYSDSLHTQHNGSWEPDDKMVMLSKEESSSIPLPNFIDRLVAMGKSPHKPARWFPYVYEVVICQWSYLLLQQRCKEKGGVSQTETQDFATTTHYEKRAVHLVENSASLAVAVAPMLLEVIKQSIGFRIHFLFHEILSKHDNRTTPPLIILDDALMASLEQVVRLLTDACLDPRNFDDWDRRQTIVDVNAALILFLRDMFGILAPSCVHRLILVYFSRFLEKESAQDTDSKIGLRCSWETTKLRLDAATALIRFVDLIKVNSPYMLNWKTWWDSSTWNSVETFFGDQLVQHTKNLGVVVDHGGVFPPIRPHWLVEMVTDICLRGTEHVEAHIQQRSASLLHELVWTCSQASAYNGIRSPVATMFFTLLDKLLVHGSYLSNFSPKSPLRKYLLPCAVYVLQGASPILLRTYFRGLCNNMQGKGQVTKYNIVSRTTSATLGSDLLDIGVEGGDDEASIGNDRNHTVVEMFTLLNLALKTLEFGGSEEYMDLEDSGSSQENVENWRREFLLSPNCKGCLKESGTVSVASLTESEEASKLLTSSVARRWQSHDGAMVIVNTVHQIILEMYGILRKSPRGVSFLNPIVSRGRSVQLKTQADAGESSSQTETSKFTYSDILLFVRSSTSVYLHALSLQESDLVITRTLSLSAEVIKIFGIAAFLEAVGETLQHWMRVILFLCGARRAAVRIESTDLLELILRTTWECFGSFFRIRVPLLAVQTEVMERIFATAASRYYREQRKQGGPIDPFSTVSAEASLAPLWRTLDRMETQPASQNVAFREALIRMAGKLKILYRAYIATRVLSLLRGDREGGQIEERDFSVESKLRAARISIMRVVNASGGHSKQYLGFQGTRQDNARVAHFEAVEDALLEAADVFSPTELPEHRFSWLRMLAELHASRKKYAEEATCHFQIHITLSQAAMLHGALWSNTPFLPWTENQLDAGYINGSSPSDNVDVQSDLEFDDGESLYGRPSLGNISSRRMFYRVANSVGEGANTSYWDNLSMKTLFCGVAFPSEYHSVKSWMSLKEMEENMVEEAEAAGELFLKAGIIENSRLAWNVATQYFASRYNYGKLQSTYGNLSRAIVSSVPTIDPDVSHEVTSILGRFYRVWFHGGAPDELTGIEFVYRAEGSFCLDDFGAELKKTVKSIIQENTPIHLVLDGRVEERIEEGSSNFGNFGRIGPAPLAPVKVKITPLRPLFSMHALPRGLPEWFYQYVEDSSANPSHFMRTDMSIRRPDLQHKGNTDKHDPHHREHSRTFSVGVLSSLDSVAGNRVGGQSPVHKALFMQSNERTLTGVDRFCFFQPRDRHKGSKDWWKTAGAGGIVEKSVKVTQLQVGQPFPACVTRQPVVHRLVYSISPLEAGVDTVSQWCSLLFRTAVATIGTTVLGTNVDPGIGTDAAKVVADSIHSSHVKDMGLSLLRSISDAQKVNNETDVVTSFDRLSENETQKLQVKLARLIVVFLELLHILIARNRDVLLEIIHERKNRDTEKRTTASGSKANHKTSSDHIRAGSTSSLGRGLTTPNSLSGAEPHFRQPSTGSSVGHRRHMAKSSEDSNSKQSSQIHHKKVLSEDLNSIQSNLSTTVIRTDSAIAVQSELQRAFTNLVKALQPNLQAILRSESPRWLKQCLQENYFSMGSYRNTKIQIAEELCLSSGESPVQGLRTTGDMNNALDPNFESEVVSDSIIGGSSQSVISKGSDRYAFVSF